MGIREKRQALHGGYEVVASVSMIACGLLVPSVNVRYWPIEAIQ